MATAETIPAQEIADLQAAPEPVMSPAEGKNRLQKRFDKLTRRNHELAETVESWQKRYNLAIQHAGKLATENSELKSQLTYAEKGWKRALDLRDQYKAQLRQRIEKPPLTPNFHEKEIK